MQTNVYYYLIENNLLEDFLTNFTVKRRIAFSTKERVTGYAYYKDNESIDNKGRKVYDKIPLNVYRWNYCVTNEYSIFGNTFTTQQQYSKESSDEREIPFGKKGFYNTDYSNLGGYESACYTLTSNKNVFSVYGKLSFLALPNNLKQLFEEDQELANFVYMYYTLLKDKQIDEEDFYSIKRIFQIEEEIKKLEREKQELMSSLNDMSMIKK